MPEGEREDLEELLARRALTEDAARPDAVEKRHAAGGRTARENLADLVDPGSFVEYGRYAIAAQRGRRELEDLIPRTPGDGLLGGTARVNGDLFDAERAACAVLSYDYTVLAGTQGALGHRKKDRLFELIERMRLPVVFYAEGGGGRPGDTDYPVVSALDTRAFALWAKLSGLVPRIAIVHGRCFAGNAVIAGCADLIVATEASSLGMGGPAMIAGGGLGDVPPDEVGPIEMQAPNGVVDVVGVHVAQPAARDHRRAAHPDRRVLSRDDQVRAAGDHGVAGEAAPMDHGDPRDEARELRPQRERARVERRHDGVVGVARPPAATLGEEDRRQAHPLDQLEQAVLLAVPQRALRAGEHRVVVGEHRARGAVDRGGSGHEPVGGRALDQLLQVAALALGRDRQAPVLDERARIHEVRHVLARRAPAAVVALADRVRPRGVLGLSTSTLELGEVVAL